MEPILALIELGCTIGADLLAAPGATCPRCGEALQGSPLATCKPTDADDEFAGRLASQAACDRLSAVLVGVMALAIVGHLGFSWHRSRPPARHARPAARATLPPELFTSSPVASLFAAP